MSTPLTLHFMLEELTRTGGHTNPDGTPIDNTPDMSMAASLLKVAEKLEEARDIWTAKLGRDCTVRISYGYRCKALNDAVGSQDTSAHLLGLAADAIPLELTLREAFDALVEHSDFCADVDQLIIERGCVHIGLPIPAHNNVARHELRLDVTAADGTRHYPLYGHWTPQGVEQVRS